MPVPRTEGDRHPTEAAELAWTETGVVARDLADGRSRDADLVLWRAGASYSADEILKAVSSCRSADLRDAAETILINAAERTDKQAVLNIAAAFSNATATRTSRSYWPPRSRLPSDPCSRRPESSRFCLRLEVHLRAVQQPVRVATPGSDPVQDIRDEVDGRFLKDLSGATLQQRRCTDIASVFRQGRFSTLHPAAVQLRVG